MSTPPTDVKQRAALRLVPSEPTLLTGDTEAATVAWVELPLQELMDQTRAALDELSRRLETADAVDQFRRPRVPDLRRSGRGLGRAPAQPRGRPGPGCSRCPLRGDLSDGRPRRSCRTVTA